MEKTALAQFIEWYSDLHKGAASLRPSPLRVKEKAVELLKTEKQQMIAFTKFCLKTSADSDDEYFDNYFESKTHNP